MIKKHFKNTHDLFHNTHSLSTLLHEHLGFDITFVKSTYQTKQ